MKRLYLVEGAADVAALKSIGCKYVIRTNGTTVVSCGTSKFIKSAAAVRPIVMVFDPDGPGRSIEERVSADLKNAGAGQVSAVHVPKKLAHRRGKIGVAEVTHANLLTLLDAELSADRRDQEVELYKLDDLSELGLIGPDSYDRRRKLARFYGLPISSARALLDGLNILRLDVSAIEEVLNDD